jgi:hypothetical protein
MTRLRRGGQSLHHIPLLSTRPLWIAASRGNGRRALALIALPLALAVLTLAGCGIPGQGNGNNKPTPTPTPSAFAGKWASTDKDQSNQTMTIVESSPGSGILTVSYADDVATVCGGEPATATGTGNATPVKFTVTLKAYCIGPNNQQTLWGDAPYVFDYHKPTDTMSDNFTIVWHRVP